MSQPGSGSDRFVLFQLVHPRLHGSHFQHQEPLPTSVDEINARMTPWTVAFVKSSHAAKWQPAVGVKAVEPLECE